MPGRPDTGQGRYRRRRKALIAPRGGFSGPVTAQQMLPKEQAHTLISWVSGGRKGTQDVTGGVGTQSPQRQLRPGNHHRHLQVR